jgi:glycine cleavage system H protein
VEIKKELLYAETHEWVRLEDGEAVVGISDFAQEELNDVVYVELPEVGDTLSKGDTFATVESVKAASDVYIPLSGEILDINEALEDSPGLVNEDPYGDGWFVRMQVSDPSEAETLLDAAGYAARVAKGADKGGH